VPEIKNIVTLPELIKLQVLGEVKSAKIGGASHILVKL